MSPTVQQFRKSSKCDSGHCVEVAMGDEVVLRNSTDPLRTISFSREAWSTFVAGVVAREFDVR